jgi:hypothetical protein
MATEGECKSALEELESMTSGIAGVQGVGINGEKGECFLVVYVDKLQPEHAALPTGITPSSHSPEAREIPVQAVEIGELKPF